ncbi:MAG: chemotaxis protein [Proteobacteria bacterium]|nr:chemotaxis protein [Pseudomonadota bacterium]
MALLGKLKQFLPGSVGRIALDSDRADRIFDTRVAIAGGFLILSIVVVAAAIHFDIKHKNENKTFSALTLEQQVISQQIAINALAAASGDWMVLGQLAGSQSRFKETILILDNGDSLSDLPPLPETFSIEYSALKDIWQGYDKNVNIIVAAKPSLEAVSEYISQIKESLPELISLSNIIVSDLINTRAPGKDIALASGQLALVGGMENSLNLILMNHDASMMDHGADTMDQGAGMMNQGAAAMTVADRFSRNAIQIERQLIAMLKGSRSLGIEKFKGAAVVAKLVQFADLYSVVKKNVDGILKNSSQLIKVRQAATQIHSQSSILLRASDDLISKIQPHDDHMEMSTLAAIGFVVLLSILMITLLFTLIRRTRARLAESKDQNDKNQRAILRLLDEMGNLADGDLSIHTTVSEDITGAIADSVNYSIDALRDLVGTINKTAVQVSSAVRKTQGTTSRLEKESATQAREIIGASNTITEISKSMSTVSDKAADSAAVARKSVSIAHQGGETVRQAIAGMETIRGQIQETSKRIKRLGESSQEIGDIVNLITEISDQTNILALNAAIQASMAGEAGRGFAVVADEVQRLAERTGDATKQIEALVKTIQADTNAATASMEQSTSNVVKGAQLTENAGSALDKIEQVSMNLAQRILEISDATKAQAAESVKITQTMDVIQQITMKTSQGSGQASESIGVLSDMVKAMHKSVAGFKLPGIQAADSSIHDITELSVKGNFR